MKEDKNLVENKSIEDIIKENEPEKKPKRKIVWLIVFIVSLVLCICCVVFLVLNTSSCTNGESQYKKLSSQVVSPTLTDDNKPNVKKTKEKNPIDFKVLNKINKDIVGWIKISDTNIDYPILRAPESDQSFYLHRNTILYGHNMANGTMFADLHKFEDSDFFSKHKTFKVYTPKSIKTYKVYSAYEYDDRHINNSFDHFRDDKVFKEYIDYSLNPTNAIVSNVRKGTKVTINDKLITLSTCTNNRPENRFLVQGVLIKNERTE
nr:class B sortase [Ruminococcus sp. 1001270H_150608_F2]